MGPRGGFRETMTVMMGQWTVFPRQSTSLTTVSNFSEQVSHDENFVKRIDSSRDFLF